MAQSIPLELLLQCNVAGFKSGMNAAQKEVKDYTKKAKGAKEDTNKLSTSFLRAGNSASIFYGPLNGVSGRLTSIGVGLRALPLPILAVTTALTAMTIAMAKAIGQSQKWEMQELMLAKQLELTGYNAGKTAAQLTASAKAQGKNTLTNVEAARAAQSVLLGFDSVQGKVFDRTMAIAMDIVQVYGGDLSSAVTKVAKALEDPASKLESLIRVGAKFTDTQEEQIKKWSEQGQAALAHDAILSNLERRLGGTAIEAAKGYAGTLDTLGHNTELFFEAVGKATGAATGIETFLRVINKGVEAINEDLNPDRKGRMDELRLDIIRLQKVVDNLGENTGVDKLARDTVIAKYALKKATTEYKKLFKLNSEEIGKQFKAKQAGQKKEDARAKKAAAEFLDSQQTAGLKALVGLESNLKIEGQKIKNAHSKRLKDIDSLVLTETEIKARGFEDIASLQDNYRNLSNAKHEQDLADLQARNNKELQANRDKLARIATLQVKAKEDAAKLAGKIGGKDTNAEFKYKKDLAALVEFHKKELYTKVEFEKLKTQLAENYAKTQEEIRLGVDPDSSEYQDKLANFENSLLGEENALKSSYDRRIQALDNFKLQEQGLDAKYAEMKGLIDEEYQEKKATAELEQHGAYGKLLGGFIGWEKKTNQDKSKALIGMGAATMNALAGQSKKAFRVKKAMMIAETVMSTYQMAVNSYNALSGIPVVGPVLGAIAAAGAIAFGVGQVNTIRAQQPSQYHQGIDYVQQDLGNVSLTKGERVLAPRLNKDLTGYLDKKRGPEGEDGGMKVYMTNHISALDGASVEQILMKQGGAISKAISRHNRRV